MTAGQDPVEPAGGAPPGRSGVPERPPAREGTGERPGPLPPRIEPTWVTQPGPLPGAARSPGTYPRPYEGPPGTPYPAVGGPLPAQPAPAAAAARRRGPAWPGALALALVLALAGVVIFQARQIDRLNDALASADARVSQGQAGDQARIDSLEGRAEDLEKQAGQVFNPEAIAAAVLPSVFRVSAGDITGTAFAVDGSAGGGTHLFTNFHVVESVWRGGERAVRIERRGETYAARIVRVDQANDVAQLTTTTAFAGLVTAPTPVKSGQQIVVVGAPLGLDDTVTTGVVSAFREVEDGSGPVIQFSAPINPGNSGGPVINGEKQVVGIATAKARDAEGIGLAVPITTACDKFKIC